MEKTKIVLVSALLASLQVNAASFGGNIPANVMPIVVPVPMNTGSSDPTAPTQQAPQAPQSHAPKNNSGYYVTAPGKTGAVTVSKPGKLPN